MKPSRDDLRVRLDYGPLGKYEPVSDADLAAMGLIQAPECGECEGGGHVTSSTDYGSFESMGSSINAHECPKCDGSGYGRLVSLDVDAEALREALSWADPNTNLQHRIVDLARQVLAALDGEDR